MKIVVCDTGPILRLSEAGILDLLEKTGRISIPRAYRFHVKHFFGNCQWKYFHRR